MSSPVDGARHFSSPGPPKRSSDIKSINLEICIRIASFQDGKMALLPPSKSASFRQFFRPATFGPINDRLCGVIAGEPPRRPFHGFSLTSSAFLDGLGDQRYSKTDV
jgi:hypothetical protein